VGAGLGGTTAALCDGTQRSWLCLEPDPDLVARVAADVAAGRLPGCCRILAGTVSDLPATASFDAILYVDVLEHIERDDEELASAAVRLKPGGALVVLAPAHGWLYSPFDAAIGHHRRYTRGSLRRLAPPTLIPIRLVYLDSVGLLASAANRAVLRQALPTTAQIDHWDRWMVPLSRRLDALLGFTVGKSLLGIWRAPVRPEGGELRV
jgi:SAM-dependent methyltransferase